MEQILIKTSQDGSTFSDLQTPSTYKITMEDLDNDSYRSVMNGNLIRNRISPRWIKLELTYNRVTDSELNAIARAINTNQKFYVLCKSPAFGNMGDGTWVSFAAYCSNFSAEMLQKQLGWTLSFNIIQSDVGGFQ